MQRDITSPVNAEQTAYLAAVAAVNGQGWPDYPVASVRPAAAFPLYLGEGAPLYAAGLGTVSLCPLPTYLLQAGDAQRPQLLDLDKLDMNLMYGEILALAQTIGALDAAPASALQARAHDTPRLPPPRWQLRPRSPPVCLAAPADASSSALPRLDITGVYVTGVSSGGFMATQLQVAYSGTFDGAGHRRRRSVRLRSGQRGRVRSL